MLTQFRLIQVNSSPPPPSPPPETVNPDGWHFRAGPIPGRSFFGRSGRREDDGARQTQGGRDCVLL